jgi:hypothetical protein
LAKSADRTEFDLMSRFEVQCVTFALRVAPIVQLVNAKEGSGGEGERRGAAVFRSGAEL